MIGWRHLNFAWEVSVLGALEPLWTVGTSGRGAWRVNLVAFCSAHYIDHDLSSSWNICEERANGIPCTEMLSDHGRAA